VSAPHHRCAACGAATSRVVRRLGSGGELLRCSFCGHLQLGTLPPGDHGDEFASIDLATYQRAMAADRQVAARALISAFERLGVRGTWLDVGCSFGWLVEEAGNAGFEAFGVDPSGQAVDSALSRGLRVRRGAFPDEDFDGASFDVITMMDVLEHFDDPSAAMRAVTDRLRRSGWVAIQVPVSTGIVFRTARLLEVLTAGSFSEPLRRMMQLDFAYPHVHYFNQRSLVTLLARHGFEVVDVAHQPIATGDFLERVSYQGHAGALHTSSASVVEQSCHAEHSEASGREVSVAHRPPRFLVAPLLEMTRWTKNANQRLQAMAVRALVGLGSALGTDDLLRVIARRADASAPGPLSPLSPQRPSAQPENR
jgi:SAM-dependent methyltransferase